MRVCVREGERESVGGGTGERDSGRGTGSKEGREHRSRDDSTMSMERESAAEWLTFE